MPEGEGGALARLIDALPPERREQVFTHTSWALDRGSSYERLEFLGDSVLELAVARALYDRFPEASEGRLAKIRAHVVSRQSCAVVARELGLGARPRRPREGRAGSRARADLAQPQRARRPARGSNRRRLPRGRLRRRRDRPSSRRSTRGSSSRARDMSTRRRSSRKLSRGRAGSSTTRFSRSTVLRTSAGSSAPP